MPNGTQNYTYSNYSLYTIAIETGISVSSQSVSGYLSMITGSTLSGVTSGSYKYKNQQIPSGLIPTTIK